MKRSVVALVGVAILTLSACTKEGTVTEAPDLEGAPAQSTEEQPKVSDPEESTAEEPDESTLAEPEEPTADDPDVEDPDLGAFGDPVAAEEAEVNFGDTATWDDGTQLSIAAPKDFEPSDTAAGGEGFEQAVSVEVTLTNGSDEPLSTIFLLLSAESGGSAGEQIFDYGAGLELPFEDVGPGDEVTFTAGFGVEDPEDLQITVGPDLQYDDVTFSQ